ncbi:hypothetical protein AURDEDRAFT_171274 [Auricularia subglabra TFB-10046 SS5]|nr:hypothetical protein AURDEDRAFT_171274 [Auricularia subglabra TFB-10046 SS5]
MAKRRSTHNDSDSERSSPAPKRSRLGDATNAPEPAQKAKAAKKALAPAQPEEEAPADSGEDISEDEDDEMLEVRIQEVVRAKLASQKDKAGRIAEYGVIETLYMTNFMCHARLGFGFGPQMNFIIGHNGSGKSAALSALTIALGGKTNSTGRGNGLKSFIKEGQTQSTVKVGIKNGGDDAYRPDVYGPRIYIERKFTKEGSSSYRITSAEGKLVSTKRSELNAICDHMNIQVDNPLNILTQDAARQFLSASNARDKYSFFIKGTQLESLMQSYDVMADKIESMKRQHDVRREGLADLKEKRDRASKRFEQANRAREMKDEKEKLGGELAWAFVNEKRQEVEEAIKPMKKAQESGVSELGS